MFKRTALYSRIVSRSVISPAFADEGADTQKFDDTELLITTLTADDQEALAAAAIEAEATAQAAVDAATADAAAQAAADADTAEASAVDADLGAQAAVQADLDAETAQVAADAAPTDEALAATAAELQEIADLTDAVALQATADLTDAEALQATADLTDAVALQVTADETDAVALQTTADTAAVELQVIQDDIDLTATLVGELSEEQIFSLNRSLNNAADGKLLVNIDAEDLQRVIDGNYNRLQINTFTQSFEQEARFLLKSDKFIAKAEETGDDKFLDHAARMEAKGADQKAKFDSKIERFALSPSTEAGKLAKQEAKSTAKAAAKGAAKGAAKSAAKDAAKSAAKSTAKDAAKSAAKSAAKDAAKRSAKSV